MGTGSEPTQDLSSRQQLVLELRRAKRASGMSYARLEARTPYSRASLERYVNGKLFPSRDAVLAIAQACGADPELLVRLWDAADLQGVSSLVDPGILADTGESAPASVPEPEESISRRLLPRRRAIISSILAVGAILPLTFWLPHLLPRARDPASAPAVPPIVRPTLPIIMEPEQSMQSSPPWCGNWDPNPRNEINVHEVARRSTLPDGSWIQFYEGDHGGRTFIWARLENATVGSVLDIQWIYTVNNSWYQCGDVHGNPEATVLPGSTETWTAGVPVSSITAIQAHHSLR